MRRSGFTMVEMLIATALAALLMLSVLVVTASLARTQAQLERTDRDHAPQGPVVDVLRFDLGQAQQMSFAKEALVVEGFSALDPETLEPTHRPARIVFRLGEAGDALPPSSLSSAGGSLLLREQTLLDEPGTPAPWIELVSAGVKSFEAKPVTKSAEATTDSSDPVTTTLSGGGTVSGARGPRAGTLSEGGALPEGAVSLRIDWSDGRAPLSTTLFLR